MVSLRSQCLLACIGCGVLLVWWVVIKIGIHVLDWFVASGLFLVLCVFADIYRLEPSSFHTHKSMVLHYIINKVIQLGGLLAITRFRRVCQDLESSQAAVLRRLLENASKTAFAKEHGLATVRTVDEFRKTIPMTTYEDYLPYVNRVLEGEENVMICAKVDFIAVTSGTTSSKSKLYPKSLKLRERYVSDTEALIGWAIMSIQGSEKLRLQLMSGCPTRITVNEQGFRTGPISASSKMRTLPYWSTPKVANELSNDEHKAYVDLIFSLRDREIRVIFALVAPSAVLVFTMLEKYWKVLCDDIERGTIYSGIPLSAGMRVELERLCHPDPVRAAELRDQFSKGFDGIVPRIWPRCESVMTVSTGTFQVYGDIIRQKYLGNILLVSSTHYATEAIYGVNLWPDLSDVHYASTVGVYFFEYLAVDDDTAEPILLHQVELGRHYEIVITTYEGLYRYRTGDVVEFTKYYYQLPIYKFVRRTGDFLNLMTEKLPDVSISEGIRKVFTKLADVTLVDYTCTESTYYEKYSGNASEWLYHVIFVEADGVITDLGELAKQVDEELVSLHFDYRRFRVQDSIHTLKLIRVRSGTFNRFKAKRMADNPNTSSMQFKIPRVIRSEDFVNFFLGERLDD